MERSEERPEIAMVSRIRVEVRGETMQAAERAAIEALDHARMAGILEGYVPTLGEYTDHHFNMPGMTAKPDDQPEPWRELGLPYYGRLSFTFAPMAVYGGLKQYGHRVEMADGNSPAEDGFGHIVLLRQRPVTRENTWEVSPLRDAADETGEAILIDIRSIKEAREGTPCGAGRRRPAGASCGAR